MASSIKLYFLGRHANRTPLAYPIYQHLLKDIVQVVNTVEQADFVILGFRKDIYEHREIALKLAGPLRRQCKVIVFSEEPLWDLAWTSNFAQIEHQLRISDFPLPIRQINHVTSDFFQFSSIPYFLTTDDRYILRYRPQLQDLCEMTPADMISHWQSARYRNAFFAERRLKAEYSRSLPDHEAFCLAEFRTRVAESCAGDDCIIEGLGWRDKRARQRLVDWHSNKLAMLAGQCVCVSALENVHLRDYVTEKFFDSVCCWGIPVYSANENHRIHEIADAAAWINIWGLTVDEAALRLREFRPTKAFARRYLAAAKSLIARLTVELVEQERKLFASRLIDILKTTKG